MPADRENTSSNDGASSKQSMGTVDKNKVATANGAVSGDGANRKDAVKLGSSDAIQAAVRAGNINIHQEECELLHQHILSSLYCPLPVD